MGFDWRGIALVLAVHTGQDDVVPRIVDQSSLDLVSGRLIASRALSAIRTDIESDIQDMATALTFIQSWCIHGLHQG